MAVTLEGALAALMDLPAGDEAASLKVARDLESVGALDESAAEIILQQQVPAPSETMLAALADLASE